MQRECQLAIDLYVSELVVVALVQVDKLLGGALRVVHQREAVRDVTPLRQLVCATQAARHSVRNIRTIDPSLQMAVLPAEAMTELLNEALSLFVLLNEGDQELDNALERVRRDSRVVAQATDDIRQVVLSAARSALQPIAIGVNGGNGRT